MINVLTAWWLRHLHKSSSAVEELVARVTVLRVVARAAAGTVVQTRGLRH